MGTNMQRLSDTLANRMKRTAKGAVPTTIELGIVNANLSITTDSLKDPIPKGEYMVDLTLTGNHYISGGSHRHESDHVHSGGSHSHTFRGLKSGDRVLVAWCGNEPVVIAVVVSS